MIKHIEGILLFSIITFYSCKSQDDGLNIGDSVPVFEALSDEGKIWNSSDIAGKKNLVVYFYPAAMTMGCTKQACSYRDNHAEFDSLNTVIVGVSGDNIEGLKLFKQAYELNFTLLSDSEGKIAKLFGVPIRYGEKELKKEVEGVKHSFIRTITASRWTFVIDKNGKIIYKSTGVNPFTDAKKVIEILKGSKAE